MYTIVIQIKLSNNNLGNNSELKLRHKLEEEFDKLFNTLNIGFCDGGQIGFGTMEIFIEEIKDIDFALDIIIEHLKAMNIESEYKIAWKNNNSKNLENFKIAFSTNKDKLFSFSFFDFQ